MQHGDRAAHAILARTGRTLIVAGVFTAVVFGAVNFVGVGVGIGVGVGTTRAPAVASAAHISVASTVWSKGGAVPTENNPWTIGVTTPVVGDITIVTNPTSAQNGEQSLADVTITAPSATAANPLRLTFKAYAEDLPQDTYPKDVQIFHDGSAVGSCPAAVVADPDACVTALSVADGIATFTVLSSGAGHWQFATPVVGRLSGADRFATAVDASQAQFPSGQAGAVVLARADDFADALVGAPLAAQKNAPLLLTSGSALPASTQAELVRVLSAGGRVYLLGGTSAIPASVESQLIASGYQTTRLAGVDRYATAVAVADALGDPTTVLLATGTNFPDALAAGPAAAHVQGAVLLTGGTTMPSATAAYLSAHAKTTYAIGGPAAAASPTAQALIGADRSATAVAVATKFFATPSTFGVATGDNFPDALAAGALLAHLGVPLVLSGGGVSSATLQYVTSIAGSAASAHVFGGTSAVPETVRTAISNALLQESTY